jgi:hypothetical protein
MPVLARLIYSNDDEVLAETLRTLAYISGNPDNHIQAIQAVLDAGIAGRLIEVLSVYNPLSFFLFLPLIHNCRRAGPILRGALITIGILTTGNDDQLQVFSPPFPILLTERLL